MPRTLIVRRAPRAASRGLSLVETMVGLALGLAVVAGAVQVVATQARLHQAAMLEARLAHDLHAAAERLHRSLRRAGSTAPGGLADGSAPNPYDVLTIGPDRGEVNLAASRDTLEDGRLDEGERFAFRVADGVLQMRLGAGTWQALTDASRLRVTRLDLRLQATPGCDGGRSVRHVHWAIVAEAVADPRARRTVEGSTRVRNDRLEWAPCPTSPATS